jgi:hypothetical protein
MHPDLASVSHRILNMAKGALAQANQHAVYYDPCLDHWSEMSLLNAALAGELFIKAIIAKEHPLLIFRDLFQLDDPTSTELKIEHVIEKGKTYGLEHLPKLLWVSTGERLPDLKTFEDLRKARNALQHFCAPGGKLEMRQLALAFLYNNIDPLIAKHFGLRAIEFHEDTSIGYDYVVDSLVRRRLLFTLPDNFELTEINLADALHGCPKSYRNRLTQRFSEHGYDLNLFATKPTRSRAK